MQEEFDDDYVRHRCTEADILDIAKKSKLRWEPEPQEVDYPLYGWVFLDIKVQKNPVFLEYVKGWRTFIWFSFFWQVHLAEGGMGILRGFH